MYLKLYSKWNTQINVLSSFPPLLKGNITATCVFQHFHTFLLFCFHKFVFATFLIVSVSFSCRYQYAWSKIVCIMYVGNQKSVLLFWTVEVKSRPAQRGDDRSNGDNSPHFLTVSLQRDSLGCAHKTDVSRCVKEEVQRQPTFSTQLECIDRLLFLKSYKNVSDAPRQLKHTDTLHLTTFEAF